MPEEIKNQTLNTESDSSTTQNEQSNQDAKTQEASSTTQTDDKQKVMTPLERAESIVAESSKALDKKKDGVEEEVEQEAADDKPQSKVEKKTTTQSEVIDATKQGDERYDKIPRFKELIEFRKMAEPLVQKAQQQQQWMVNYGITEPMLQETHGFLGALMAGDFNKAHAMMKPVFENLEKAIGVVKDPAQLPADLQTAVNSGEIKLEFAQQLHQARVGQANSQNMTLRQIQQQSQQAGVQSINAWESQVSKTDTDWAMKRPFVDKELKLLRAQYPNANPQELVQLCNTALQTVNEQLKAFAPVAKPRTLPSANGSTKPKDTKPLHGYELAMDIVNKRFAS